MTTSKKAGPGAAAPQRRQRIGDRLIANPRGQIVQSEGRRIWLSQETCRCGQSAANPGVGYKTPDGWVCKNCQELIARDLGYAYSCADDYSQPLPWPDLQSLARAVALLNGTSVSAVREQIAQVMERLDAVPNIIQIMDNEAPPGLADINRLTRQKPERGLALSPQDALHQFDDCIIVYQDRASAIRGGSMLDTYDHRRMNTGQAHHKPQRVRAVYTPEKARTTSRL